MKTVRDSPRSPAKPAARVRAVPLPEFVEPMKALGVTEIPPGDWGLEIKFDGYRALAAVRGKDRRLWSRNHKSLAEDYPEVMAALGGLRCASALLDGEIVALDPQGHSRFQLLQQRELAQARPPIFYFVFDLLEIDGRSLVDRPIEERRRLLEKLVPAGGAVIRPSTIFSAAAADLLVEVRRQGLEGIVAKAAGSTYEIGRRSGSWLKCRVMSEQEFVIGGFTPPRGSRVHFGALLVGYYDRGRLRYAGKVGTGFDARRLKSLHAMLAKRAIKTCPFADLPVPRTSRYAAPMNAAAMREVRWVRPDLVGQVRFAEWTEGGLLRQPAFLGLREDKAARDVVREAPAV
ncbi:MAG: ATP-dependent ligase [Verrucomicrobia bacterium]|nr:ATP-dependent ligase [Verrucomicrobiota bacterium]